MDLIGELFSTKEAGVVESLWQDDISSRVRLIIAREIGKRLSDRTLIFSSAQNQLMALLSLAKFANSDTECVYVAGILKYLLPQKKILPYSIDYMGYELASRCLVSLGFFLDAMAKRTKYSGAPEPKYYREIGKQTFDKIGRTDVADNFENWEIFLRDNFN